MKSANALVLVMTLVGAGLRAQSAPATATERVLRPGTVVELTVRGVELRGDVVSSSPSSLVLRTSHGVDSLPRASIGAWRWQATRVGPGAKIGAIAGTVSLGLLGLGLSGMCEVNCGSAPIYGLTIGAGVGALLGGAAGAIAGSLLPMWKAEHGATPIVAESPLAAFPVKVYLAKGGVNGSGGAVTQAGVQLVRGTVRAGLEVGRVGLGESTFSTYYGDPSDPRMWSVTEISRSGGHVGVVVERRLIDDGLWAVGSAMRRWQRETTTTRDWRNITGPDFSHPEVTTTLRDDAGVDGSFGVVAMHRVIGDIWIRVDARQHFRPSTMRTLTAGIEL